VSTETTVAPLRHAGAAAYRRNLSPKQLEAEVFARAARAARAAANSGRPAERARAFADSQRLWNATLAIVLDPTNTLPGPLRASIGSLSHAVLRECEGEGGDLDFVAEMAEQMAAGLFAGA